MTSTRLRSHNLLTLNSSMLKFSPLRMADGSYHTITLWNICTTRNRSEKHMAAEKSKKNHDSKTTTLPTSGWLPCSSPRDRAWSVNMCLHVLSNAIFRHIQATFPHSLRRRGLPKKYISGQEKAQNFIILVQVGELTLDICRSLVKWWELR